MVAPVVIMTLSQDFSRISAVDLTDGSYPSFADVKQPDRTILPSTAAIIDLRGTGICVQNSLEIIPFGTDTDDDTFNLKFIGWRYCIENGETATAGWVSSQLCELVCTLGAMTGTAGMLVDDNHLYADTITITGTSANAGVHVNVQSPADDTKGKITLDLVGYSLLQMIGNLNSSAASFNALVARL